MPDVPYGKALTLKRLFAVYAMRTIVLRAVILAEACSGRYRFFGIHAHPPFLMFGCSNSTKVSSSTAYFDFTESSNSLKQFKISFAHL